MRLFQTRHSEPATDQSRDKTEADRAILALSRLVHRLWCAGTPECAAGVDGKYSAADVDRWTYAILDDAERAALNAALGEAFGDRLGGEPTGWDSGHPIAERIRTATDLQ